MKTNLEPILLTGLRFFEVEQNQIVTTRPLDLKVKACITLENFPISLLSGNRYRVYPSSEQESTVRFLTKAFSSGYSGILTSVVDNNSENLDPFSNVSRDIFRKGPENLYDCHLIIYNKNPESEEISLLCSVLSDPSMFHNIYHPAVRPRTIQFDKKTTIIPPKENQILDGIPPLSSVDLIDIPPIQLSVPEEDYIARIGENKPNLGVKLPAIMKMNNLRRHRTLGPPMKQKPRLEPIVFYEVDNKKELKKLAVNALQKIGVLRGHPDFTAYWSQLYKSCQFALRKEIKTRHITKEEILNVVEEHIEFYRRQM